MDGDRFDTWTRLVAGTRTRRQLLKLLGGGVVASLSGLTGADRVSAAECPSGVVCSAQCCPNASDICLAGRCTSCPSGVICSAGCCPNASDICLSGQCTGCPSGVSCSGRCCDAGETCLNGLCTAAPPPCGNAGDACTDRTDCCSPLLCSGGVCAQPKGGGTPCPPGSRECDGVCYPGGCCSDADCGDPCLSCGTDHVCHGCASGQLCAGTGCCTLASCQRGQCGSLPNGCGGTLDCGTCPTGQTCQGGQCVASCTPATCHKGQCGSLPDGCGGTVDCGTCDASQCQTCDGDSHTCVSSCASGQTCYRGRCCIPHCAGKTCGDDGCGGTCGACGTGETCFSGACCPTANICGDVCMSTPCDASKCQVCDGAAGICVSTCGDNQHCASGKCVCDTGYATCRSPSSISCSHGPCCISHGVCCPLGFVDKFGICCCSSTPQFNPDGYCFFYPDKEGRC